MARAGAARLHAGDHDALIDLRHARDMRGAGDRLLDRLGLAAVVGHRPRPIEDGIAGGFGPQLRRVGPIASRTSITGCSGSYSMPTSSAASWAASLVSAMT